MRTLRTAVALGFIGATVFGMTAAAQAQGVYLGYGYYPHPYYHGYYYHRHYPRYGYYGGGTWNGCPPGWTWQGGNCAPYQGPRGPYAPPGSRFWWQ